MTTRGARADRTRRHRRRRFQPADQSRLEPRELLTVAVPAASVRVFPRYLPPTNGRFLPVTVVGQLIATTSEVPKGFFHVTDEYRRVEPFGSFSLTPAGRFNTFYRYNFQFTIPLQAQRSTNTADGRHYYILVGATDSDNTGGRTIAVLVPKTYSPNLVGASVVRGPRVR